MVNMSYTPILRWREAEKRALFDLSEYERDFLLPMLSFQYSAKDIREGDFRAACSRMATSLPQEICTFWGDGRPFLADFDTIAPLGYKRSLFRDFMVNATKLYLEPIPVVDPCDEPEYIESAISLSISGELCLRFRGKDLFNTSTLLDFCAKYNLSNLEKLTILFDLLDKTDEEVFKNVLSTIDSIPNVDRYKNIIVAASAFPVDMSKITSENDHIVREEWTNWKKYIHATHLRYPSFADYTIRHPIYKPALDFHQPTTTIKYTIDTEWLCLKGEVGNYKKYLASANALMKAPEFCGSNFSAGDRFIADKGRLFPNYIKKISNKGTGNNTQWIYAGINHHIVFVINQLSNLGEQVG